MKKTILGLLLTTIANLAIQAQTNGLYRIGANNSSNFISPISGIGNNGTSAGSGGSNILLGYGSGSNLTSGSWNNFFGYLAGQNTSSSIGNNFFGYHSGKSNTTGSNNNFFGTLSGNKNTIGHDNCFIGVWSGDNNTSGNRNIFLGKQAGQNNISGNDNIVIGTSINLPNSSSDNQINIGNVFKKSTNGDIELAGGNVGIGTTSPKQKMHISGGGIQIDGNIVTPSSGQVGLIMDYYQGNSRFWSRGIDNSSRGVFNWYQLENDGGNQITAMTLDNGKLGIGTTTPGAGIAPAGDVKLHVAGDITINNGNVLSFDPNYKVHAYLQYDNTNPSGSPLQSARFRSFGYYGHRFESNSGINMVISQNGNVGIGKSNPSEKLHVEGNFMLDAYNVGNENGIFFREGFNATNKYNLSILAYDHLNAGVSPDGISINAYDGISFSTGSNTRNERMRITKDGNIGIGTTTTGEHKLAVEGTIGAREVKVNLNTWADFVFEKNYALPSLEEVEKHILENGHLENIPTTEEVIKDGIFLGDMNAKLLQKVEELTLYTIEQEKKIKTLESKNEELSSLAKKLIELETRLQKVEKN